MASIVIPVSPTDTASRVQISVHVQAEVVSAEAARRRANVWLLENVGNLLRAEEPELVAGETLTWRVDVVLTSPTRGALGRVGRLEIEAMTGEVLADETIAREIVDHAQALAGN
jgi:hypothetical protein